MEEVDTFYERQLNGCEILFAHTFNYQLEILPRFTIRYNTDDYGFAIEWLWFTFSIFKITEDDN